ncbi:MAG: hypothetical protein IJZ85_02045 [Lachnospiraceae bacterium]|nr:hypothetical protein [Lachnospiraceae bacterium]
MNIIDGSSGKQKRNGRSGLAYRLVGLLAAVILTVGCLTACGKPEQTETQVKIPTYDEKGNYIGFADIAEDGDPDKALARGCYVVDHSKLYGGSEAWENFVAKAEAGENAFLRVAIKIYPDEVDMDSVSGEGTMFYDDLYYYEGKYYYFCYNGADDIRADGPYTYLRELTGVSGNPAKERNMYVLTDSLELTYDDVEWSFLSSNLETVTKIRFQWLGFTIYMREEFQ